MTTVLITGATSGLGAQTARELANRGWTVLVHGRSYTKVDALVAELREAGGHAQPYVADLASLAEVRSLAERVVADQPRLDVLINNAGVGFGAPGTGREQSVDGHELRFAVNYLAPYVLGHALVPLLRSSSPARLINVGSVGQQELDFSDIKLERDYDGISAYRRAKLALAMFTFDLAEELRGDGVTVNVLHPASLMATAMVAEAGVAPLNDLKVGVEALLKQVLDPELAEVTGQYFDVERATAAHSQAYDLTARRALREITGKLLAG